ncbi:MAG: LCP family protein [Anaerolineae bacterium]|nr:LCP family protein [Anaerolineae bacterium]
MDDVTRQTNPDDKTNPIERGASGTEFTQLAAARSEDRPAALTHPISKPHPIYPPAPPIPAPYLSSGMTVQHTPPARPHDRWPWFIGGAVALFGLTILFSLVAFLFLRFSSNRPTVDDATSSAEVADAATPEVSETPAPTATVGLGIQPWDGKRRLTILLMGIDKRPNEKGTSFRTDSMIIFSIDPTTKTVGLLSIPRDLFVDIPGDTVVRNNYGLQRVNSAYVIGELARPGYGPQLAMQTVQYNLGMRINHYVVFEFNTVINAVDAVGGIDINVPYTINDPAYPNMYFGYDPLYIPAGMRHMNGTLALKYARTRHQTSDFDRAKRQQQVIMAVRDKILNLNMAPTLLAQAPQLWDQFSRTTRSDLQFEHLLQLAVYLKDIPKENIHQGVIDLSYVTGLNYNGAAVLIPERAKLGPLLRQVFGANYNS